MIAAASRTAIGWTRPTHVNIFYISRTVDPASSTAKKSPATKAAGRVRSGLTRINQDPLGQYGVGAPPAEACMIVQTARLFCDLPHTPQITNLRSNTHVAIRRRRG